MYSKFIVEGEKLTEELLASGFEVDTIYANNGWQSDFSSTKVVTISDKEMERISGFATPSKVLSVVNIPKNDSKIPLEGPFLVLDNIADPGNLGSLIRTAEWFGFQNIICSKNTVDWTNSKVVQSSMGAIFRTKIFYTSLLEFLTNIEIPVYMAVMNGENAFQCNLEKKAALVIGSESHGISEELLQFPHKKITIPKNGYGESLNAGVAAGILLSRMVNSD